MVFKFIKKLSGVDKKLVSEGDKLFSKCEYINVYVHFRLPDV
ncbi:hypothetical protein [Methanotorris igneus]|uniref:Uncharacterized protein n=1 Tax=Methanotorris igneus (strain DSM 5666 / JCM 11834 / Kol 5) TaxID=880724 RepID=F6BBC1_METIK|nr:hypothetical protein [Methanotorris igneus]AEF97128.1 hypothetical protein Metig_1595 [Methanotorris igneus Kol 5]